MMRRDDILASVCLAEARVTMDVFPHVVELARKLSDRYRFWEIVLLVDSESVEDALPLVDKVSNLRLIEIRDGVEFYRRRVVAAAEAIGDVVAISTLHEIAHTDIVSMLEMSAAESRVIVARRRDIAGVDRLIDLPISVLGRGSGFEVNIRNLRTLVLPRTQLNILLAQPGSQLALRFPPRSSAIPIRFVLTGPENWPRKQWQGLGHRLDLSHKLLVNMAPRLLTYISLSSGMLTLLGGGFAVYVVGAWLFMSNLAPGWLSTSFVLSLTAMFLGLSIFGISLGLQCVLSSLVQREGEVLTNEINRVDLLGQVARELNVAIETGNPERNKHDGVRA